MDRFVLSFSLVNIVLEQVLSSIMKEKYLYKYNEVSFFVVVLAHHHCSLFPIWPIYFSFFSFYLVGEKHCTCLITLFYHEGEALVQVQWNTILCCVLYNIIVLFFKFVYWLTDWFSSSFSFILFSCERDIVLV